MRNLKSRVALITGGASGLGRAIADRFAQEGAHIVIADIDGVRAEAAARDLQGRAIETDITDPAAVERTVVFACEAFGRLDIMINNAGVEALSAPIHECTLEDWGRVNAVNLNGTFFGMKYALARMVAQGSGTVVNIVSTAGLVGMPGLSPYAASKAAVVNLTRAGALEYGPLGIRVNAVAPTGIMTELSHRIKDRSADPSGFQTFMETMNPMKGTPTPADIADAVAFLASDEARFVNGVILPVDGGYTAQ